nr:hypothetical protein Iba_chr05fCG6720 [Ipomoea batatas]
MIVEKSRQSSSRLELKISLELSREVWTINRSFLIVTHRLSKKLALPSASKLVRILANVKRKNTSSRMTSGATFECMNGTASLYGREQRLRQLRLIKQQALDRNSDRSFPLPATSEEIDQTSSAEFPNSGRKKDKIMASVLSQLKDAKGGQIDLMQRMEKELCQKRDHPPSTVMG